VRILGVIFVCCGFDRATDLFILRDEFSENHLKAAVDCNMNEG